MKPEMVSLVLSRTFKYGVTVIDGELGWEVLRVCTKTISLFSIKSSW